MEIVRLPAFSVIGIRVEADWDGLWKIMPDAWRALYSLCDEIPNRVDDVLMDIALDKRGDTYVQLIGAEVSAVEIVPDGMEAVEIAAQSYVHYRHNGSLPEIATSFGRIYEWAAQNGVHVDDFKLDIGYSPEDETYPHDLYVRVKDGSEGVEVARVRRS
jgi:predicted transcriptional regulator YdeE